MFMAQKAALKDMRICHYLVAADGLLRPVASYEQGLTTDYALA